MVESAESEQILAENKLDSQTAAVATHPGAKAYSYIRMSTREQLQGDSLRRQNQKCLRYVEEHNLELVDNYDDIGVSAFRGLNSEQGALSRFLAAVKSEEIPRGSYLIIESMDRLTRQAPMTAVSILNEIIGSGITVVTLDDGAKYSAEEFASNHYKLFMAVGAMMRAHDESLRKSGLLSEAWGEKRRKLINEGTVLTAAVPGWLRVDRSKGKIEPIAERVAIIQEIFELACSGYGIYSTARLLNERGEKAWGITRETKLRSKRQGKPIWRDSYIKKILVNRAVLGEFQPHKHEVSPDKKALRTPIGEVITDYYPQVISPEVFNDAHVAMGLRRNGARGRKGTTYANLFTGMIHCVECGSGMRYLDKGKKTKDSKYLKCSLAVSGAKCAPKSYRYEAVEQVILSCLESLDIGKVLGGEALSRRLMEKKNEREMARISLETVEKKIKNINEALAFDGGSLPNSTISMLRALEHDQKQLKLSLSTLDAQIDDMLVIDPIKRRAILDDLMNAIKDEDFEKKSRSRRALASELQRMIDAIVLRPDIEANLQQDPTDQSWNELIPSTGTLSLEKYLSHFGFEVLIRYRNGEDQIVRGMNLKQLKFKGNKKFSRMKSLSKFESSH